MALDISSEGDLPIVLYQNEGEWSAEELKQDSCAGIRVFYFKDGAGHPDHPHYQEDWKDKLGSGKNLEAGTVISLTEYRYNGCVKPIIVIQWDCGYQKAYTKPELSCLRVFDLGPAGYQGEMVYCDKCLIPVMGFAWRVAKNSESGDIYDLCFTHYNENEDHHSGDRFYCNIPSGDLYNQQKRTRRTIEPRNNAKKFDLIGLFKNAKVTDLLDAQFTDCRVVRIEHNGSHDLSHIEPQQDMRKARHYNCCAEIEVVTSSAQLEFRSAGCKGRIDIKVTSPGVWGSIFAEHHPPLCIDLLREMASYESKCYKMKDGNKCFMRPYEGKCYSVTICGTDIEEINDKGVWETCHELKIVRLYMNKLKKLPKNLENFKNSINFVCIQNNQFLKIPHCLREFTQLRYLNMHGNLLSVIPNDAFDCFSNLKSLYLGDNDLTCLPDAFNRLTNLRRASFRKNSLTRLPPSFSSLSKLENLDLSYNAFIKFPKEILPLPSLKFLNIKRNKIQKFSPAKEHDPKTYESTLSFLQKLQHLQIAGNPVSHHKTLVSLKNQLYVLNRIQNEENFSELSNIEPTRSLRVDVLGNSGAGKTSFIKALVFGKYVIFTSEDTHRHTVGIDRYYLPVEIGGKTTLVHIWDHAGDNEYAMMNDLFISNNTLIWLVVNLNEYDLSKPSMYHEQIGHWLIMVMSHNSKPVVWIICTHDDKIFSRELEKKLSHIKSWTQNLCDKFPVSSGSTAPKFLKDNVKIIHLTNTYGLKGTDEIKKNLKASFASFSSLMDPLPVEWQETLDTIQMYTERELCSTVQPSQFPVVPVSELEQILNSENCLEVLKYLHEVGEIYLMKSPQTHEDGCQKEVVILNLNWLINLLKEVYRHNFDHKMKKAKQKIEYAEIGDVIEQAPLNRKKGFISEPVLQAIVWKCEDRSLFDKIISLFQDFNLTCQVKKQEQPAIYFFPHLIKKALVPGSCSGSANSFKIVKLCVTLTFSYFLPQLFPQRLGLQFWKNDKNQNTQMYANGFRTELPGEVYLEVACASVDKPKLEVHATSNDSNLSWKAVEETLWNTLGVLSTHWDFKGTIKVNVRCPKCETEEPNTLPLFYFGEGNNFSSTNSLKCHLCDNITSIQTLVPPHEAKFLQCGMITDMIKISNEEDVRRNLQNWSTSESKEYKQHQTWSEIEVMTDECPVPSSQLFDLPMQESDASSKKS